MFDYYRFNVRLLDVSAKLWRRFLLQKESTFADLHGAIQDACGWQDCHLFMFQTPDEEQVLAASTSDDSDDPDAKAVTLSDYFHGRHKPCHYRYDFGDDWVHEVTLEGIEKHSEEFERRLLDGAGMFPPEDCGSTPGYERCVVAARSKGWNVARHGDESERRKLLEWLRGWHPDAFDLAATARAFDT